MVCVAGVEKFVLADLRNRGLADIFEACIDGLTGFPDAIKTVCDRTNVRLCVLHLVRAAMLVEVEQALKICTEPWDENSPTISKTWQTKWLDNIITLFDFSWPIRRAISTNNSIESVNSVIRKQTRNPELSGERFGWLIEELACY